MCTLASNGSNAPKQISLIMFNDSGFCGVVERVKVRVGIEDRARVGGFGWGWFKFHKDVSKRSF